jgi:hypothetical protein
VSDETRGILERAHETADEITARSRTQADDRLQWAEREARDAIAAATERVHDLESDADRVWQERQALIDDVSRIATELKAVADDAGIRFPVEPQEETMPLPELPPLPPAAPKQAPRQAAEPSVEATEELPPPPPDEPPAADSPPPPPPAR